jgi:hypothetical protein
VNSDDHTARAFESGLESCYFVACEQPESVDVSQTVSNETLFLFFLVDEA